MRRVTLPSGKKVRIVRAGKPARADVLFADALALEIEPGDVQDLPLADFHVVRAIATKHGLLAEEPVTVDCMNCGAAIEVKPCARLEIAPWEDGELDDPELDAVVPDARFEARTVREALPLLDALAAPRLELDDAAVRAMGCREITADFLMSCDDATFEEVTDAWLDAHYVPRLACEVVCEECQARNTIDAPYEREFERGLPRGAGAGGTEARPLPPLAEFVELAHAIADPLLDDTPDAPELVVDDGTPAVDDGGVPLLGSYLPPPPKDAPVPMRPGTVTIYYRTFAATMRDEPDWDWEDELRETIEHEIEHHVYFLRGHDPMDEEERAEIARDAVRVVGRRETARRELGGFLRSAWPLILIGAVALAITLAESRCAP